MARSEAKTRRQIEIPTADLEWFLSTHSAGDTKGSFSWIMTMLLHSYREVCENPKEYKLESLTAVDLTLAAATSVRAELNES